MVVFVICGRSFIIRGSFVICGVFVVHIAFFVVHIVIKTANYKN